MEIDVYVEKTKNKQNAYSVYFTIDGNDYKDIIDTDLYRKFVKTIEFDDNLSFINEVLHFRYDKTYDEFSELTVAEMANNNLTYLCNGIHLHLPDSMLPPYALIIQAETKGNTIITKLVVNGIPLTDEEYKKLSKNIVHYVKLGDYEVYADDSILKFHNGEYDSVSFLKEIYTQEVPESRILFKDCCNVPNFKFDNCGCLFKKHQVEAIEYIVDSFNKNMGILLADDMGLGKTATAIGVLKSVKSENPSLVIVPKSVVGNWINEFKRFAPDIKCQKFKGSVVENGNVYIATYGDLTHSLEMTSHAYSTVVLDEAQQIKNSRTVAYSRLKMLIADNRIAMTGTPMENTLMDLWSIMDFVQPGLLGTYGSFKEICKMDIPMTMILRCIRPFCIRRMKSDIGSLELPAKTEHTISVDMCDMEKRLYNGIIDEYIAESKRDSTATVIKYISKLKMMCGNPRMMFNVDTEPSKLAHVREIIRNTGYKPFVVFTQYRKTAEMLCENLNSLYGKCGIIIDGTLSANERTAISDRFQKGEYPFIVLTLKAGNCGLTLTNSCNLIHYDRWWNPAVENQATDRVYRIGQKNDVNIYKLVCKGTIEERIGKILDSKTKLFNSVVEIIKENRQLLERKINE